MLAVKVRVRICMIRRSWLDVRTKVNGESYRNIVVLDKGGFV